MLSVGDENLPVIYNDRLLKKGLQWLFLKLKFTYGCKRQIKELIKNA